MYFNIEQCRLLLQCLQDDRLYPFYAVAVGCGLRLGEILALHWEDINFENSTLSVKRTLQKVNNKGRFGELKSKKARRSVAMPRFLDALKNRKESGLIFATSNGTPFAHQNIHRHFKKTLVKLGLPEIRFHDLRHSYASILASQNVHPKTVQEALGHSTITLTLEPIPTSCPVCRKKWPKN